MKEERRPFWNPYAGGVALGLVALASLVLTGKGLGASGGFRRLVAFAIQRINPVYAEENGHISSLMHPGQSLLDEWIVFLVIGTFLGGLLAIVSARRFRLETIHGPRIGREGRWILALVGGVLAGFGAQLARGCTSGQAVTGGAQLALGSWVFMFSVFGGAYALAYFLRKQWI